MATLLGTVDCNCNREVRDPEMNLSDQIYCIAFHVFRLRRRSTRPWKMGNRYVLWTCLQLLSVLCAGETHGKQYGGDCFMRLRKTS